MDEVSEQRYGATQEEWAHFSCDLSGLGLAEDLFPIVSDANAEKSPNSSLGDFSKVPSQFNSAGLVVGIPKWPQVRTTHAQIDRWREDGRLGLGLVCRRVRAIDIDVDDRAKAEQVVAFVEERLGVRLPRRVRSNSGKLAMLVEVPSEEPLQRARVNVDGGMIEFLHDRQFLVLAGTHATGARIEWEGGLPAGIPSIDRSTYAGLLEAVQRAPFARGDLVRDVAFERAADFETDDPVARFLIDQGLVIGESFDGRKLYVSCPKKGAHSKDSGPSESCWMTAGSGGQSTGHYSCRHESHGKISDSEFFQAVGYIEDVADQFDVLDATASAAGSPSVKPAGLTVSGDGSVPATISNLTYALEAPRWIGVEIGFDDFLGEIMFRPSRDARWRPLRDEDRTELRLRLERGAAFKPIKRDDLRDVVRAVARKQRFDSAEEWLKSIEWDGEERIGSFLVDHLGCADTAYTRAVSRYWWTAHAGRILYPGCQVDMVPVLVSPEGRYKSTTLQALVPSLEHFTEIDLATRDPDLSRQMRGKLLGELGELKGLSKRETADLKAKITSRFEEWTPKYVEGTTRYLRRLVFVGTTNESNFMAPAIGKRRWLPVVVEGADPLRLAAARDQLWAEAREVVLQRIATNARGEVEWEDAYRLAPAEREAFEPEDSWTAAVDRWLEEPMGAPTEFTTDQVFSAIFGMSNRLSLNATPVEQSRMAEILRGRGFEQVRKRINGHRHRVWTVAGGAAGRASGPAE